MEEEKKCVRERNREMKCSELPWVSFMSLCKMRSLPKSSNCILWALVWKQKTHSDILKVLLFHRNAHSAQNWQQIVKLLMFTTLYDYWDQLFICVVERRGRLGLNLLCHTCHEHLYKGKDNSNYGAKCLETHRSHTVGNIYDFEGFSYGPY